MKVWNLSLSLQSPCDDTLFSDFGAALDERSKKYDVQFVVAAGNYENLPLRKWPPQSSIGEADRICPPADSIRAITVGSLAHLGTKSTCVAPEQPSPFSRRGPGPAYLIKPELSTYGGNCDDNGRSVQTGTVSIDGSGHVAEDIGTSFACPLVSTLTANVIAEFVSKPIVPLSVLAKALLLHSTFLKNPLPDRHQINYTGIGRPPDLGWIVNCAQSSATVIFEVPVKSRLVFMKKEFPMPHCLTNPQDGLVAEVFMTLLYAPPLDQGSGPEYCRCNVDASLGTMDFDLNGKKKYTRQIFPIPKDISEGREEHLIKYGYKWSPLKLYYRKFHRGPTDKEWRLSLNMLSRSGDVHSGQDVILIITIRDPGGKQPVYNELIRLMQNLEWDLQDFQIKSRPRLRPR